MLDSNLTVLEIVVPTVLKHIPAFGIQLPPSTKYLNPPLVYTRRPVLLLPSTVCEMHSSQVSSTPLRTQFVLSI